MYSLILRSGLRAPFPLLLDSVWVVLKLEACPFGFKHAEARGGGLLPSEGFAVDGAVRNGIWNA